MSKFLTAIAMIFFSASYAFASDAGDHLKENSSGENFLLTTTTPTVDQTIFLNAAKDTTHCITFPGTGKGEAFTFTVTNESAVTDTLLHLYYAPLSSSNPTRTLVATTAYIIEGSTERVVNFRVAEGDSIRYHKMGAGNCRIYIGGVKNLRGQDSSDY